jgi:hypothetical protein
MDGENQQLLFIGEKKSVIGGDAPKALVCRRVAILVVLGRHTNLHRSLCEQYRAVKE